MQRSLVTVARDTDRIELLKIRFSGIISKAEQTLRDSTSSSSNQKTDEGMKKKANVRAVEEAVRRNENLDFMEEIESLMKCASPQILGQLGWFLKSEYAAGGDEVLDILEEGEILE